MKIIIVFICYKVYILDQEKLNGLGFLNYIFVYLTQAKSNFYFKSLADFTDQEWLYMIF